MLHLRNFLLLVAALIGFSHVSFAEEEEEELEEMMPPDPPESYVLPLSYDEDAPILIIPIPHAFKLAFNGSTYPDVMYVQFVPHNENITYFSECITICQSTDILDAHTFIRSFKDAIEEAHTLDDFPNYTSYIRCGLERGIKVGYYVSEHPSINPHNKGIQAPRYVELLKVKTVQSEDRVWVIQYAAQYDPMTTSDDERDELIDKIHSFFKTCKVSFNITGSPL